MKLTQLPPLKHKGDLPLVFGIFFPQDEMKVHPAYTRDAEPYNRIKPRRPTLVDPQIPGIHIDNRFFGVIMALKSAAKRVWKLSMFVMVSVEGHAHRAIIFSHNSSAETRELPPPEIIERLKETLGTTRDPEWYQALDELSVH